MWSLLLQTAVWLMVGQVVLGGIVFFAFDAFAWLGIWATALYIWYVVRLGKVLRGEMAAAQKRKVQLTSWVVALTAGLVWQVPALAYWLHEWAPGIWQGVWAPFTALLGKLWPAVPATVNPWLWTMAVAEVALLVLVAAPRTAKAPAAKAAPALAKAVSGEWAPARRHHDVVKKGRRLK